MNGLVRTVIICLILVSTLTGCASWFKRPTIKTEVVQLRVPVLYCPAPDRSKLVRPELAIHSLTPEQQLEYDELVKSYVASIKQLQGYSMGLEASLDEYQKISEAYAELRKQFIEDWNNIRAISHRIDPKDVESFTKGIPVELK